MKKILSFENFTESRLAEAQAMAGQIQTVGLKGNEFVIKINGKEYGYGQKEGGLTVKDIAEKFAKILKFSAGKALAWLKKNSELTSGSAKNEAEDMKSIGFNAELFESDEEVIEEKKKDEESEDDDKKKEKEEEKEEEKEDEPAEEDEMDPESASDFIDDYTKTHKLKLSEEDKEHFAKIQDILKQYAKDKKALGRK